ncbi:unnamed protein product [Amoebophrya sp. A120]|nr:unnamed protein product [Amoebophrya sp. A120]|eukprot:GSA120T00007711001.1
MHAGGGTFQSHHQKILSANRMRTKAMAQEELRRKASMLSPATASDVISPSENLNSSTSSARKGERMDLPGDEVISPAGGGAVPASSTSGGPYVSIETALNSCAYLTARTQEEKIKVLTGEGDKVHRDLRQKTDIVSGLPRIVARLLAAATQTSMNQIPFRCRGVLLPERTAQSLREDTNPAVVPSLLQDTRQSRRKVSKPPTNSSLRFFQEQARAWRNEKRTKKLNIAVCITGRARTLAAPEVFNSLHQNLTSFGEDRNANVKVFYVLDLQGKEKKDFASAFKLLPPTRILVTDDKEHYPAEYAEEPAVLQKRREQLAAKSIVLDDEDESETRGDLEITRTGADSSSKSDVKRKKTRSNEDLSQIRIQTIHAADPPIEARHVCDAPISSAFQSQKLNLCMDLVRQFEEAGGLDEETETTAGEVSSPRDPPAAVGDTAPSTTHGTKSRTGNVIMQDGNYNGKEKPTRFDWLVRTRPDLQFLSPIGSLRNYDPNFVHLVQRNVTTSKGDTQDHFALLPRKFAEAYMDYDGCTGVSATRVQESCAKTARTTWTESARVTHECALNIRLRRKQVKVKPLGHVYIVARCTTTSNTTGTTGGDLLHAENNTIDAEERAAAGELITCFDSETNPGSTKNSMAIIEGGKR